MAVYSNGGFTTPDIWLVISLILIASVSGVLNPIVFRHNLKKKRSLPRDLYLALSATDFVSSIVLTSFFSYGILQPKEESCLNNPNFNCENAYYEYYRPAKMWEKLISTTVWWLYFTPCLLTTVNTLSRWYKIRYPFRRLPRNKVETLTVAICLIILSYYAVTIIHDPDPRYKTNLKMITQLAWNEYPLGIAEIEWVDEILGMMMTIPATVASVMTIHRVFNSSEVPRSNEQPGKRKISAIKVALQSAGSTLAMTLVTGRVLILNEEVSRTFLYLLYHNVLVNFLPILTSGYNSVVYVVCSDISLRRRGVVAATTQ